MIQMSTANKSLENHCGLYTLGDTMLKWGLVQARNGSKLNLNENFRSIQKNCLSRLMPMNKTIYRLLVAITVLGVLSGIPNALAQGKELQSTYSAKPTPWLRGNIHTHTTNSDGNRPPQEVVNIYAELNYDFLMISDHDKLTDPTKLDPKGMILIPGNEITAGGPHLLHVNAKSVVPPRPDRQAVLNQIAAQGGFAVMNHPNWNYNHCDLAVLEKLQGYAGIAIFNVVVLYLEGSELATDKWDRLLAQNRRLWGFATDDSHNDGHCGLAWLMVQTTERSIIGIVEALRAGRFYSSTGVVVNDIQVEGWTVTVRAANAQQFRIFGAKGRMLATAKGSEITYTVNPGKDGLYIRVEAYGEGDARAWLQPMFCK